MSAKPKTKQDWKALAKHRGRLLAARVTEKPPLTFVNWEVGVNLRELSWTRRAVNAIVRKYKLQHGQAVIFFNNARDFGGSGSHPPKSRIFWMWNGHGCTIIPAVDEDARQVSYQLLLNEWLRASFGCPSGLVEAMGGFDDALSRRIAAGQAAARRKAG
jgi:hypothetical protein